MKKILSFMLLLFVMAASAQTVRFTYDECGNRTARFIESKEKSETDFKSGFAKVEMQSISETSVEVLPNPSAGPVTVSLLNYQSFEDCHLELYSSNGALLKKWQLTKSRTLIDLSTFEDGVYILKIHTRQNQLIKKLIKY